MKPRVKSMIWNIREKKNIQSEQQEGKRIPPKNEDRVRNLWDKFKHTNIKIIGVSEGEEKESEIGSLFEKIMKRIPNLVKEIDTQVQAAQRVPKKISTKRPTPRHKLKSQRLKIKRES